MSIVPLLSFLFASFPGEIHHVFSLLKALDYLCLDNLHFGLKGNIFHHLLSFPGSSNRSAQRTIFIYVCSDITHFLERSPPRPMFPAGLHFNQHKFFVYILVVAVFRSFLLLVDFQSLVIKGLSLQSSWKGQGPPYNSSPVHLI